MEVSTGLRQVAGQTYSSSGKGAVERDSGSHRAGTLDKNWVRCTLQPTGDRIALKMGSQPEMPDVFVPKARNKGRGV